MSFSLLAVDDDASSAELIVRIAERCGFEAFATSDPRGVMELSKQLKPSVLSIDVNMPNINATQLLELLAEANYRGRIVIVSGQDYETLRGVADHGEKLGLIRPEFMQKPIDVSRTRQILGSFWRELQPTS